MRDIIPSMRHSIIVSKPADARRLDLEGYSLSRTFRSKA